MADLFPGGSTATRTRTTNVDDGRHGPEGGDEEVVNPYVALREAKIARNQQRLRELGLLMSPPRLHQATKKPPRRPRRTTNFAEQANDGRELRRSKRLKVVEADSNVVTPEGQNGSGPDSEILVNAAALPRAQNSRKNPTRLKNLTAMDGKPWSLVDDLSTATVFAPPVNVGSFPSNSARAIRLDVKILIDHFLGRRLERTGKAFVMEESARVAAAAPVPSIGGGISFNKYSGVQEWAGDVMFLWINLGAPHCDVVNEFMAGGAQVTWFGGSKMHHRTPVIQKLLRVGKETQWDTGARATGGCPGAIVLWCREYLPDKRTFSPYTCLGTLSASIHKRLDETNGVQ